MSVGAKDRTVTITGHTPGLTYGITVVALSNHLPSPVVAAAVVTLSKPRSVHCVFHTDISHIAM